MYGRADCTPGWGLFRKLGSINPSDYFKKRKECRESADRADTVAMGKRRYKSCMEE
jgi:hypothetical protein